MLNKVAVTRAKSLILKNNFSISVLSSMEYTTVFLLQIQVHSLWHSFNVFTKFTIHWGKWKKKVGLLLGVVLNPVRGLQLRGWKNWKSVSPSTQKLTNLPHLHFKFGKTRWFLLDHPVCLSQRLTLYMKNGWIFSEISHFRGALNIIFYLNNCLKQGFQLSSTWQCDLTSVINIKKVFLCGIGAR